MTMRIGGMKVPLAPWADEAGRSTLCVAAGGAALLLTMIRSPRTAVISASAGALLYVGVRGLVERERQKRGATERGASGHVAHTASGHRPDRPPQAPEDPVDEASWESFPASDSPSWSDVSRD